ncbi:zf-HC2 domain-containing protein [Corallococcus sp. ZKHCc1 1396]|uniref:Zf-HC2 domain-containing protein n=1 Tax=Corallococcus soli TaxID=2710757 RepID=A0ABR9PZ93_9BACT|nr:zf-HC2 domain-containing protein [Corallococcus soli]MBE4753242.1 zf-HC2 domain-containing protein [Corallococcus soli]
MIAECVSLTAFVDGHLAPEAHEGFLSHLTGCEACGIRFHELLQLDVLGRLAMDGAQGPRGLAALGALTPPPHRLKAGPRRRAPEHRGTRSPAGGAPSSASGPRSPRPARRPRRWSPPDRSGRP